MPTTLLFLIIHTCSAAMLAMGRSATAAILVFIIISCGDGPSSIVNGQQPIQARALLQRNEVALGDSVVYQIVVDGVSQVATPVLPPSPDFDSRFLGGGDNSMRSVTIVQGRRTEQAQLSYVLQWEISPNREGTVVVPQFALDVGGQKLPIPEQPIRVRAASPHPDYTLTLELDQKVAFVGQPVHARLVWTLGKRATLPTVRGPDGGQIFDVAALDPRPAIQRGQPAQDDRVQSVPFLGGQAIIRRETVTVGGRQLGAWIIELAITPRRPGTIEVGRYSMVFDSMVDGGPRSVFDFPGDQRRERVVVSSEPVKLDVAPLPDDGKPANFSGMIGEFSLSASAGSSEANVGDPVPLSLVIRGPEPLSEIKPPSLETAPTFSKLFRVSPEGWEAKEPDVGTRTFATTIRPRTSSIDAIPPLELNYFNTKTGKYDVARSNPIPLKVKASREVTAADGIGGRPTDTQPAPGVPIAALTTVAPGLAANTTSLTALSNQSLSIVEISKSPSAIGALLLPPVCLAVVMSIRRRSPKALAAAANRRALRDARHAAARATAPTELIAALRSAAAIHLGVSAAAVTSSDLRSNAQLRDAAQTLMRLEQCVYDREADNGVPLTADTLRAINSISSATSAHSGGPA